jgi:serine/threonine-protein kinase
MGALNRSSEAMMPAPRLKSIFVEALARAPGRDRVAYLDEACRGEPTLRADVEAMLLDHERVGQFLASHHDEARHDVTVTLEPGSPGTLADLAEALGGLPRVLLRDTEPMPGQNEPVVQAASPEMPAPGERPGRYQLFGEIARGGMGAVLKARDPQLGRDLAVKVLLEAHRDNPELVRRFVEEAQIGGQLQHRGIVPIYDIGRFADRRPFFAMKLVRGRTLAELLAARPDSASDLPRFLAIFESVCQTVAYAHDRGVIHRDLKPSNVMVGSFGEVQVMDWGLAKVLPRGGAAEDARAGKTAVADTVIATARSGSGSDLSRAGSVLGTPSYMAPEQARGEVANLDERVDVFALGSILCELLTGRPVFTGPDSAAVLRSAARGETGEALARLEACAADGEMIALARDCLAVGPDARPRDASVVAARINAYLASVQERLRTAERERAVAEARAIEERRRRRLQVGLAASLLGLIVTVVGGSTWIQRQRAARIARAAAAIDNALADASRLGGEARATSDPFAAAPRWSEALAAARRADELIRQGDADAARRLRTTRLVAELGQAKRVAQERADRLRADRELLSDLESARGNLSLHEQAGQTDQDYGAAFKKAGLDLDTTDSVASGRWVAARSSPVELVAYLDNWAFVRRLANRPATAWRRLVAAAQAADPDAWRNSLRTRFARNDAVTRAASLRLADEVATLESQPAASLVLLAHVLKKDGERDRADRVLQLAARRHPNDYWVHRELARVRSPQAGSSSDEFPDPESAVRHLTAAIAIRPESATAHCMLGLALVSRGRTDEGLAECREAIRLKPDVPHLHNNYGTVLCDAAGDYRAAEGAFREAIRLDPGLAVARANLGNALLREGKFDQAVANGREATQLGPTDGRNHALLGSALRAQGKPSEAADAFREAIRLKPDLAGAYVGLGGAMRDMGRLEEGVTAFRAAVRLNPNDAGSYSDMGDMLRNLRRRDEALAAAREAVRLAPEAPIAHNNLGAVLCDLVHDYPTAIASFRHALKLKPDYLEASFNLGNALLAQGKPAEAEVAYRAAVRLGPSVDQCHFFLARSLQAQDKVQEALSEYRTVLKLAAPGSPAAGGAAQRIERINTQIALGDRLTGLLEGTEKPRDNAEAGLVAQVAFDAQRFAAAARISAELIAAEPKLADEVRSGLRYNAACAAALAANGQGRDGPTTDEGRVRLRQQCLDWLKADRDAWTARLDGNAPDAKGQVAAAMTQWLQDPDLAGVREPAALAKLPEAERPAWESLWADVRALRTRAQ